MIPVVTPVQMAAVDAAAPEPAGVLIARAGAAVARAAEDLLGGRYGRRVTVIVGKGNNGADGRAAAGRLRSAGVRVGVIDAAEAPEVLAPADLYVDAAFGTGLSRPWSAPGRACPDAPVLAVDIPSGLHGLYGSVLGGPVWPADRTVTFAALKPGLLLGSGPRLCGEVVVADIGLNVDALWRDAPSCRLIGDEDVETLPAGSGSTHKWQNAVLVVAGSPGMGGAAALVCAAAFRSGARMVHLSAPDGVAAAVEAVRSPPPPASARPSIQGRGRGSRIGYRPGGAQPHERRPEPRPARGDRRRRVAHARPARIGGGRSDDAAACRFPLSSPLTRVNSRRSTAVCSRVRGTAHPRSARAAIGPPTAGSTTDRGRCETEGRPCRGRCETA